MHWDRFVVRVLWFSPAVIIQQLLRAHSGIFYQHHGILAVESIVKENLINYFPITALTDGLGTGDAVKCELEDSVLCVI